VRAALVNVDILDTLSAVGVGASPRLREARRMKLTPGVIRSAVSGFACIYGHYGLATRASDDSIQERARA
jgi:hypothetical protein